MRRRTPFVLPALAIHTGAPDAQQHDRRREQGAFRCQRSGERAQRLLGPSAAGLRTHPTARACCFCCRTPRFARAATNRHYPRKPNQRRKGDQHDHHNRRDARLLSNRRGRTPDRHFPRHLRIWERRYDIVIPSAPQRGAPVQPAGRDRLTMIKTLVDQGYAISTVANFLEELSRRLNMAQPANLPPPDGGQHEVCVIGQAISVRACNTEGMPEGLELAGAYSDLDAFLEDETTCDTLVIELPFLDRPIARELNNPELRRRAQRIIVMYAFSPSIIVSQLQRYGLQTLRAPVAIEHIWQHCQLSHTQQVRTGSHQMEPEGGQRRTHPTQTLRRAS